MPITTSVDHSGLEVLAVDECLRRLRLTPVGRVAFVDQGEPVILPVNHAMDGDAIVFRTAPGSKLAAATAEQPIAFEIDDYRLDERTGWSVVVSGTAVLVEDGAERQRLDALDLQTWADGTERGHWIRIRAYSMTGREIVHDAIV